MGRGRGPPGNDATGFAYSPHEWRDVQHLDQAVGHYIISDRPMTEEQWIAERTKVIEAKPVTPALPQLRTIRLSRWND